MTEIIWENDLEKAWVVANCYTKKTLKQVLNELKKYENPNITYSVRLQVIGIEKNNG